MIGNLLGVIWLGLGIALAGFPRRFFRLFAPHRQLTVRSIRWVRTFGMLVIAGEVLWLFLNRRLS